MVEVRTKLGNEDLIISTGKMAKQADGSCTVQCGGTMVLVTAVCSKKKRDDIGFFPLTVEYRENTFAAGKIPGGFFKREGRPGEKEILTARMIDRPIRPLFPEGMRNEVQIVANVLSSDIKHDSDVLALIGASTALMISDIPFDGPIGGVRVGLVEDRFVINPTFQELDGSVLDLVVVSKDDDVLMLESGAQEVDEDKLLEAIRIGNEASRAIIDIQRQLRDEVGKPKREDISQVAPDEALVSRIKDGFGDKLAEIHQLTEKQQRIEELDLLKTEITASEGAEDDPGVQALIGAALQKIEKQIVRDSIFKEKKRMDGRDFAEIRNISCEVNLLPTTHGSALFTRGETQSLSVITLGTASDEQRVETLEGEGHKTFMLHYNFPPFSVGETRPFRGPGRREIGHGALAEKALKPVMPVRDEFPYTLRLVSEILESNGSSSMATVCAGSLALMAGGVPIKASVAGIALGLMADGKEYEILTDIAGSEDHYGDMDFKVAGTREGVTAVQMDLKVLGVSYEVLKEAFSRAKAARLEILDKMDAVIKEPLAELATSAPQIKSIKLPSDKISMVIGPGGKMIKKIIAETGADINIDDDGVCQIASPDKESLDTALRTIEGIIAEPEIGEVYDAVVRKIMDFGAFCDFMENASGLVHISELADGFVKNVRDVVSEGQKVRVKVKEIDGQGRVNLTMKDIEEDNGKDQAEE